jgi:trigger factor
VKRPRVTITDEDVDKQIDRLRGLRGTWEPVADGAVQDDDMLIASVEMRVGTETAVTAENVRLFARAQVIEGVTLESLGEALRGARAGEVRTVRAAVPEDHDRVDWRGREADCALTIHEIKRYRTPPLDEEFVRSSGFDSEAELRQFVRSQMEADLSRVIRRGLRGQVSRYLIDQTRLDLPEGLSQRHAERAVQRRRIELRRQGVPQAEIDKHADELLTRASQEAIDGLKLHFILEKASEQLEVEVTEEEINSQIAAIARQYNRRFDRVRDELAAGDGLSVLYAEVRDEKCLDRLLQDARIEETAGPGDPAPPKVEGT